MINTCPSHLRKTVISVATSALLASTLFAGTVAAQDFSNVTIETIELNKGVYMLTGRGGNMAVSIGSEGVFLVDDQFAPLTTKIKAAIAKLTHQPILFVVNTHWHFDHSGGNENLGKEGTLIIAHDNVRKLMSQKQFLKVFKKSIPASPRVALPTITFNDTATFHFNDQTFKMKHIAPGHTDGDSVVHFIEANVIHTGDLFFNGFYPFIDVEFGGTINGMIENATAIIAMANDDTKIIPGHGPLATKAQLVAYRDMLIVVRDNVKKLVDEGKTVREAIAAKPTASTDAKWGNGFMKGDLLTKILFDSLSKK